MLHKCANPACASVFRRLSHGKLFLLETDAGAIPGSSLSGPRERFARRVERYWLCDGCASLLTLAFEAGKGMITVPLPARTPDEPHLHPKQMQAIQRRQSRLERAL